MAWALDDGPVYVAPGEAQFDSWALQQADPARCVEGINIEAHNAQFEYAIWHNIMVPRYRYEPVPIKNWRCSMAAAMYKSMPRALGDLAKALNTKHQKDESGKFVMFKMCKPNKDDEWNEDPEDFKTLMEYCKDDVRTERDCSKALGPLSKAEQKLWEYDREINLHGIHIDMKLAKAAVAVKEPLKDKINKKCMAICGCKASQVQKLMQWFESQGLEMPNLQAETMKKMLVEDLPKKIHKVIQCRRDYATTSLAKYDAVINYAVKGVVRDQLLHHGANTGRWTGRGIQFQNLPRGQFNEDTMEAEMEVAVALVKQKSIKGIDNFFGHELRPTEVMKSTIRGLVIPKKGKILRVMDFSQIEARVLPWLAGEQAVLDAFSDGKDLYKFIASQIYNKSYNKIDKGERFIGKTAALALGYQGGAGAFVSMAMNFGVKIEEDLADQIKRDFRIRNQRIVRFWYSLQSAALQCVREGRGKIVGGRIGFQIKGDWLTMLLPCGRRLWYYKPEIKENYKFGKASLTYLGSDSKRGGKWCRIHTYGGKLAENAVQATSRDLLVHSMYNLRKADYNIIFSVHDEVVCEDKITHGSLEEMKELMLDAPNWTKGLPLDADGFEALRYRKG